MQITVRVKYRSTHRPIAGNLNSPPVRLLHPHAPVSIVSGVGSVSAVEEQPDIISGVNPLNHLFDLRKRLSERTNDASSSKAASENTEKAIERGRTSLDQIAVEEVEVRPGSRIIMHTDPRSAGADRFRFLRMCLRELWNAGKLK